MSSFADSKISLTDSERELFQILLQAVEAHRLKQQAAVSPSSSSSSERTILRVAGGWVRDKLLRRTSKDIDIALNNMSGVQFAHCVNDYLSTQGMETRTIAVIQANPDQSKHLETANLRVLGFDIDCVNLRAETYTGEFPA
jgi:tRNA nucleotidyltransferase/poly(A) polymerase